MVKSLKTLVGNMGNEQGTNSIDPTLFRLCTKFFTRLRFRTRRVAVEPPPAALLTSGMRWLNSSSWKSSSGAAPRTAPTFIHTVSAAGEVVLLSMFPEKSA